MTDPLRIFVLAGEPSGDQLGGDLIAKLTQTVDVSVEGVGGEAMIAAGLSPLFPMAELAVMGWVDVLPRLPRLLWRVAQVARHIERTRPDVVVLIDAQVFSRLVASQLRRRGYRQPILLYVAPAVWAWKPERAPKLVPLFDEVLSVLPFEPAAMRSLSGPPTSYVGHPATSKIRPRFQVPEIGPLLLLPGSRDGELRRHLPLMRDVAERAGPRYAELIIPTVPAAAERVRRATASWPVPPRIVTGPEKNEAFGAAKAAVAVTGTVTLELALAGVPMVTTYVADAGQERLWHRYGPRFAALPNILLDEELVPEVLSRRIEPERVDQALSKLDAEAQLRGFARIRNLMEQGLADAPLTPAAHRVLAHVPRYRAATGT